MCGRFVLATKPSAFIDRFRIEKHDGQEPFLFSDLELEELTNQAKELEVDLEPAYNIAPRWKIFAIAREDGNPVAIARYKWGLLPTWAKDEKMGDRCFNARAETASQKPTFRSAFKHSRCAVLADGYYEWKKTDAGKQPFYIHREDSQPMFFAGLCEPKTQTATIITTEADGEMALLHNRRPVFLDELEVQEWLDPRADKEDLNGILLGSKADGIQSHKVSTDVNKVGNNDPRFIEPLD